MTEKMPYPVEIELLQGRLEAANARVRHFITKCDRLTAENTRLREIVNCHICCRQPSLCSKHRISDFVQTRQTTDE